MRKWMLMLSLMAVAILAILPVSAQDSASIRFGHFSPDAPAVDVYVNGEVAIENLQFTEVSAFNELPAGTYSLAVAPTGTSVDDAVLGPIEWVAEAGTFTTVAAVGSVENETLAVTVFTEELGAIGSGQAYITFLHTVEGEGGLDLYGSGVQLIQNIRYPDAAEGRDGAFSREVPAGTYDFDATVAESASSVLRQVDNVSIEAGENYLIVALGPQSNEGTLLVVGNAGYQVEEETVPGEDVNATEEAAATEEADATEVVAAEGEALVRVGHFSPDAPAVDVYVDGEVVVEGLEFREVSAFMPLAAGNHSFAIAPAGESVDAAVLTVDAAIEADTHVTVAAVGDLESIQATVFTEDYNDIPEGQARITLLHTIEGEGGVDLYGSGVQLIQNLQYPAGGERDGAFSRDIPAGRYNFDLTVAENANTVLREANGVEVAAGDTLLIVALGPQANEGELLVVTPDGYQNPEE